MRKRENEIIKDKERQLERKKSVKNRQLERKS